MTTTSHRAATIVVTAVLVLAAGCGGPAPASDGGPVIGTTTAAPPTSTVAPATETPQSSSTTSAPADDPAGPPRCTTGELEGSLAGGDAGAGSVFRTVVLTNVGDRACHLTGFPGVSYVAGDDGHQVGPAAAMDGASNGPVDLAVGGSAGADLQLVNVAAFDPATCSPVPVRGLRVYPPGDTTSLFVPLETTGCSAETLPGNQLSVHAVAAR